MEAVLTVRLDAYAKEQGSSIMNHLGISSSQAVRSLFDYVIKHESLPFPVERRATEQEIQRRIQAFDACHTKEPLTLSDEELRDMRLRERYGSYD